MGLTIQSSKKGSAMGISASLSFFLDTETTDLTKSPEPSIEMGGFARWWTVLVLEMRSQINKWIKEEKNKKQKENKLDVDFG